ncbi:hypothetical protein [Roseisolibacter agri]|uniref:Uncharacterized protein n=1 Tax=Roseisolibacter agri TaxID=2014610 RepID=A0AA37QEU1_9BACT|nr:hypothetical protein [Roseisolibacter agri]GLC25035.1 hypothetical protein rosag_15480 [Roseisolibacter agri]
MSDALVPVVAGDDPADVARLERFAHLRACPACGAALQADAPGATCAACGRVLACPTHTAWPARLKGFLLALYGHRRQHAWLSEDDVWRVLLVDGVNGGTAHYMGIAKRPTADEAYAIAEERMAEWVAAGCPVDRAGLDTLWARWNPRHGAPNAFPSYPDPGATRAR